MATMIPDIALETTLEWLAKFNRHEYFTKELYKKLPKYKKCGIRREKTEIQVAFICKALQLKGIYMTPCGVAWSRIWEDSKTVDDYLKPYQDIIDGYVKWCEEQNKIIRANHG